jgi:hypothetical protein
MATDHLSKAEMLELKRKAVRQFYLCPGYFSKRLKSLSSLGDQRAGQRMLVDAQMELEKWKRYYSLILRLI